ncbi:MAG: ABC transporter ATP-binding protein [Candidatus Eutrophobiaceae bacterium]
MANCHPSTDNLNLGASMDASDPILLQVESLFCRRGRKTVIADAGFSLKSGEILGLLGLNGAGKTTILQLIAGVLSPSNGHIQVSGHDLSRAPRQARANIGFLHQKIPIYPELSVDEHLSFCARLYGIKSNKAIAQAVSESKARCGLEAHGRRILGVLSAGFLQRVGIAQAIIHSPPLLLLDEPTSTLDTEHRLKIHELIKDLATQCGIVLSSHLLSEVRNLCSRVLIIHHGRLVLDQQLNQLEQAHKSRTRVTFAFRNPPEIKILRSIPDVATVKRDTANSFIFNYRPGCDPTNAILRQSLEANWDLQSCISAHDTLESLFFDLTQPHSDLAPTEDSSP